MKYIFLLASFGIIGCSLQKKDCSKFRTGTYKYSNPDYARIVITRNDSIQIESDIVNNTKIVGAIEWVSNCRYTLTYKDAINLPLNDIVGTQIEVNITEISNNGYKCTSTDGSKSLNLEMVKID